MSSTDDNHDQLLHVFPERCSKEVLLNKLQAHGLGEEVLRKIQDDIQGLILCFHKNVASLPRRLPRCNRRGKMMKKCHEAEDRKRQLKPTANGRTLFAKTSSLLSKHEKSTESAFSHPTRAQPESTPEMDKLMARSKAAATMKRKPELPATALASTKIVKISDVSKQGKTLKTVSKSQNKSVTSCTSSGTESVPNPLNKSTSVSSTSNILIKNNDKTSETVSSTNVAGKHVLKLKRPLNEIRKVGEEKAFETKKRKRKLNRNSHTTAAYPISDAAK